ncbi:MAG TPA: hypothetical protein VHO70_17600 [Chitinispirillaceae bacterium]|nr:hypothetical protein [Chitinispirillaceae bacterium]
MNKQVDDVAKKFKMSKLERFDFGDFIESRKVSMGRGGADNFNYPELIELAKEFLGLL